MNLRERVARAIASIVCKGVEIDAAWPQYLPEADAVLAELGLTQAEPVGLLEQHARDSAELRRLCEERDRYRNEARGLRDALTDALEHNESLRLAVSSNPQVCAKDVALVDNENWRFSTTALAAWQRIRADYVAQGVGK